MRTRIFLTGRFRLQPPAALRKEAGDHDDSNEEEPENSCGHRSREHEIGERRNLTTRHEMGIGPSLWHNLMVCQGVASRQQINPHPAS